MLLLTGALRHDNAGSHLGRWLHTSLLWHMMNLLLNHWLLLTRSNMMRLCNLLLYPMRLSSKLLLLLSHLLLGHLMMGHLLLNNLLLGCMMLGCILLRCGMIHLRHTTTSWMELLLLLWVSTLWL